MTSSINPLALKPTLGRADSVWFQQSGTGAVSRSSQNKMRDIVSVKDFGAVGDGVTDDAPAIQAACTAAQLTGRELVVPVGVYKLASTITIPSQMALRGLGAQGLSAQSGEGSVKFIGPSGAPAFLIGPAAGLAHNGPRLSDLYVASVDGTGKAFEIRRINNVIFERVTAYGYTQPGSFAWHWNGAQGGEQYVDMIDCRAILCRNCIEVNEYNGVRVSRGFYQNYDSGALAIQAGSTFFSNQGTGGQADTPLIDGAVIQFFETAIKGYSEAGKVTNCRFEGCTTGIEIHGTFWDVGQGCSFNNFITGGAGTAISIVAGAANAVVGYYTYQSLTPVPVRDAGTQTVRHDATKVRVRLDNISATVAIPVEIPSRVSLPGPVTIYNNGTPFGANFGDRWTFNLTGRNTAFESYISGVPAGAATPMWGAADNTTGTAVNPGAIALLTLSKNGAAITITNCYLEILFVPY